MKRLVAILAAALAVAASYIPAASAAVPYVRF